MTGKEEKTPGGATVKRYRDPVPYRAPVDEKVFGAEIEAYLASILGPCDFVLHEIVSDKVHLDILQFAPTEKRRFWTFVTSGMSDLPMNVPPDVPHREKLQYAEMVISLPEGWVPRATNGDVDDRAFRAPAKWWPLNWLTYLARFPHQYDTGLWIGHTIPNGNPPRPLGPGTNLVGFMIGPPITWLQSLT